MIWSQDDSKIISCGMDGAVYEWNVTSYKREGESVLKSCSYTSVAVSPDSRTTFAVGSDRTLKEICDSQVNRLVSSMENSGLWWKTACLPWAVWILQYRTRKWTAHKFMSPSCSIKLSLLLETSVMLDRQFDIIFYGSGLKNLSLFPVMDVQVEPLYKGGPPLLGQN